MKNTSKQLAGALLTIGRFAARTLAIMAVISLSVYGAGATIYHVQETLNDFGTIDESTVSPGLGTNSCVPTATMNSFIFLQNEYQSILGNDAFGNPVLQGGQGSWVNAADLLAGASYMNTDVTNGTTIANWIGGKVSYLNTFAPGKITFEGMESLSAAGSRPVWDTNANPTVSFLLQMLQTNEDVELGIYPTSDKSEIEMSPSIGHALTLTGLTWNDVQGNGTFDLGDSLTLDTIDPFNPNVDTQLQLQPGNPMTISGVNYNGYYLMVALAESVPEPATAGLLLLGVGALLGSLRLRRRAS
jgi:hypothetical protein